MLLNDIKKYIIHRKDTKCLKNIGKALLSNKEYKLLYKCIGECRKWNNGNDRKVPYSIRNNQFNFWSNLDSKEYNSNLYRWCRK